MQLDLTYSHASSLEVVLEKLGYTRGSRCQVSLVALHGRAVGATLGFRYVAPSGVQIPEQAVPECLTIGEGCDLLMLRERAVCDMLRGRRPPGAAKAAG